MTRKEYMDGNAAAADTFQWHCDYYAQFVTPEIVVRVRDRIGGDRIRKALLTDPHMNNIPLPLWDAMHQWLLPMTRDMRKALGEGNSLGSTVCVAKQAARMWAHDEALREIVRNYHNDDGGE